MKTIFYLNDNKITRKSLNELVGTSAVRTLVQCAKERDFVKKQKQSDFIMGSYGVLSISFGNEKDI